MVPQLSADDGFYRVGPCAAELKRLTAPGVGEWRSLVARLLWEQDVGSSNLSTPTNFKCKQTGVKPGWGDKEIDKQYKFGEACARSSTG